MNITTALKLDETQKHESEYNGHEFWFEAKKQTRTPRFMQQILDSERGKPEELPKALSECLTAWNITQSDGVTPWPTSEAELSRLPTPFLNLVAGLIVESWASNKEGKE